MLTKIRNRSSVGGVFVGNVASVTKGDGCENEGRHCFFGKTGLGYP